MKELGKVLLRGDWCSLNLCTPQGDAPVSSSLCLEGNLRVAVWGKIFTNIRDFTSSSHALWRPHAGS